MIHVRLWKLRNRVTYLIYNKFYCIIRRQRCSLCDETVEQKNKIQREGVQQPITGKKKVINVNAFDEAGMRRERDMTLHSTAKYQLREFYHIITRWTWAVMWVWWKGKCMCVWSIHYMRLIWYSECWIYRFYHSDARLYVSGYWVHRHRHADAETGETCVLWRRMW